jgi:hypothetical protein
MYSSEFLRQGDVLTYRRIVAEVNRNIARGRIYGGLLLAGAAAEGTGYGLLTYKCVEKNVDQTDPNLFAGNLAIGTVMFGALALGGAMKLLGSHWEKQSNTGNFELLERLEAGECVPLHSGGGSD